MPKFQIFDLSDTGKIVAVVEAETHEQARRRARQRNPNYSAAPMPKIADASWAVSLREDAPALQPFTFAWRDDPHETVSVLAESREKARERVGSLNRLAESFGLTDRACVEFIRGREGSGNTLEDLGRSFGFEGRGLEHFMRDRG